MRCFVSHTIILEGVRRRINDFDLLHFRVYRFHAPLVGGIAEAGAFFLRPVRLALWEHIGNVACIFLFEIISCIFHDGT